MNFSFHPQAVEELYKAVEYYEDKSPGLGLEFSQEVYAMYHRDIRFQMSNQ